MKIKTSRKSNLAAFVSVVLIGLIIKSPSWLPEVFITIGLFLGLSALGGVLFYALDQLWGLYFVSEDKGE
jgi:hypothetical protein